MKLIIDIPEDLYKWIKDTYDNPNGEVAYSAIASGTPYNPTGDLIRREALKEQFTKAGKDYNHECVIEMLSALATIDNAPTVEIPIARWDAYCEGQKVGYEKGIEDRPHGEWKRRAMNEYLCSNCRYNVSSVESLFYKFCPKCGSDMRGANNG